MAFVLLAAVLTGAWIGAQLARRVGLPALLGMMLGGAVVGNLLLPRVGDYAGPAFSDIAAPIRLAVLAVVLLRAGLGLALADLRRAGGLALGLGLVPMLCEAAVVATAGVFLLEMPLAMALALGFLVAPLSPAIVIPGALQLLDGRSGAARRVPAALLAGAPLDNTCAVVGLGVALDLAANADGTWVRALYAVPVEVVGGAAVGLVAGALLAVGVRRGKGPRGTLGGLVWAAAGGLIALCSAVGVSFVVAVLVFGAVLRARAVVARDRLGGELTTLWSVAQYALFGLIGASVSVGPLVGIGGLAVVVIILGQGGRAAGAALATVPFGLSGPERLASYLGMVPKATIQAAFASVALDRGLAHGELLLQMGALAILLTAPVGLVTLNRAANALLPERPAPRDVPGG